MNRDSVAVGIVARFVGTNALSVLNIVCPVINLVVGLGTMLVTGAAHVISYNYGKQDNARLKRVFFICMRFIILVSVVIFGEAFAFGSPLVSFLQRKGLRFMEL